ncbi:beta-1-3-galactosyltransferase brn [Brachionus plicatilis]|uniref:Hexosyltransferase n=1 Tax=Brachionus plicatilis TaxID=10195 RepID=A0A3M7S3C1_BRAPC|nr:beta-1-3-galactosyltransferase brn [Brachionus plicatilis]
MPRSDLEIRSMVPREIDDIKIIEYVDVNNLNFSFILKAEKTCQTTKDEKLLAVIMVKSKLNHFKHRSAIRKTWGNLDKNARIRKVFLIGLPSPEESDAAQIRADKIDLARENQLFGDIVQQNFYDEYYNNTLKTIMGLKWINFYCQSSNFYAFIDDDYFLNPKLLVSYLQNEVKDSMLQNLYAGYVFGKSSPMRHLISKWYISLKDYPYSKFPPYIAAGFFILSRETAGYFYVASKVLEYFKFDDIYMGILAKKLNIEPQNLPTVYFYQPSFSVDFYSKHVMASHGFSPNKLENVWKQIGGFVKFP